MSNSLNDVERLEKENEALNDKLKTALSGLDLIGLIATNSENDLYIPRQTIMATIEYVKLAIKGEKYEPIQTPINP